MALAQHQTAAPTATATCKLARVQRSVTAAAAQHDRPNTTRRPGDIHNHEHKAQARTAEHSTRIVEHTHTQTHTASFNFNMNRMRRACTHHDTQSVAPASNHLLKGARRSRTLHTHTKNTKACYTRNGAKGAQGDWSIPSVYSFVCLPTWAHWRFICLLVSALRLSNTPGSGLNWCVRTVLVNGRSTISLDGNLLHSGKRGSVLLPVDV